LLNTLARIGDDTDRSTPPEAITTAPRAHQFDPRESVRPVRPDPTSPPATPVASPRDSLAQLKKAATFKKTLTRLFEDQVSPEYEIYFCHHCGELRRQLSTSRDDQNFEVMAILPVHALSPSQFTLQEITTTKGSLWHLAIPASPLELIHRTKLSHQEAAWTEINRDVGQYLTIQATSRKAGIDIARALQLLATAYGMPTPDQLSFPDPTDQDFIVEGLLQSIAKPSSQDLHPKPPPEPKITTTPPLVEAALTPEEELTQFIIAFYKSNNTENPAPTARKFLADSVDYYGERLSYREIDSDQQTYFEKWPTREYQITSLGIKLSFNRSRTTVTALTDFRILLSSRASSLQGRRQGTLKIDISGNNPQIIAITSEAIGKDIIQ